MLLALAMSILYLSELGFYIIFREKIVGLYSVVNNVIFSAPKNYYDVLYSCENKRKKEHKYSQILGINILKVAYPVLLCLILYLV